MNALRIGITCYPSVGGSGIVASQLGNELARLGHRIHFISYEPPFRLDRRVATEFHRVEINEYGVFKYPDYTLPLAVKMVEVADKCRLDILHVHYAVPHATAALLATQIAREQGKRAPKVVTTLHGTDITLLGREESLKPIIKYSIESSDGVTAVSHSLKRETVQVLRTKKPIEVIHNFFRPKAPTKGREQMRHLLGVGLHEPLLIHMSNLRPVKRIPDVLKVLANAKGVKLVILAGASFDEYWPLVDKMEVRDRLIVVPRVPDIENYIHASDIGIYASEKESFGMGVLETMSYGKPVIATRVGGVAEIVESGKNGFLHTLRDIRGMVESVRKLVSDPALCAEFGHNAQERAATHFSADRAALHYVDFYRRILGGAL